MEHTKYGVMDFKDFLETWTKTLENATEPREAIRSFLNRLQRNYTVVKKSVQKTEHNYIIPLREVNINVPFKLIIARDLSLVSILY